MSALATWPLRAAVYDTLAAAAPGLRAQVDGEADTPYPFWGIEVVIPATSVDDTGERLYEVQVDVWGLKAPGAGVPLVHEMADTLYAAADAAGSIDLGAPYGYARFADIGASPLLPDTDPATNAPLWHMALRLRYYV